MKIPIALLALGLAAISAALGANEPETLTYDVIAVKRKLLIATEDGERQLDVGDRAHSGDALRTGSRSSTELAVPARGALFHVESKTTFRLAHDRPGVLLEIERGRVRAVFEPAAEGDNRERLVTTPSAVLAVRGTEYGVEVEKDGDTSVVVFEGTVEVRNSTGVGEAVRVHAGESTRIRLGRAAAAPRPHGVSRDDWDRGRGMNMPSTGSMGTTQQPMGDQGSMSGGSKGTSSQGSGGSKRHGG
jgi:ferric-dicitrate binding protein FerR (iron transport regulator)